MKTLRWMPARKYCSGVRHLDALDHASLAQLRHIVPAIAEQLGENQFRILASLRRAAARIPRRSAQHQRHPDDLHLAEFRMVVVNDILKNGGDALRGGPKKANRSP
jgi:hypothetical protein